MFDPDHMAALQMVLKTGAFDRAADILGVTPSAVSQRIKLLEDRVGAVLIVRGQPCVGTPIGDRLRRHAEEINLLNHGLQRELGLGSRMAGAEDDPHAASAPVTLRLAVNADSLATWLMEAMAKQEGVLFDLVLDDQDHCADWLRRGEVRGAITAHATPVRGCNGVALGALPYVATASLAFMERWFAHGVTAESLSHAPCMIFNPKDSLQSQWVRKAIGRPVTGPTHWLGSSHAFVEGALLGLGWGMNPEPLVRQHIASGALVSLIPDVGLDIPLYWHWNRLVGSAMAPITAAIRAAAARHLVPIVSGDMT